jgi:hypothetical protein
MFNMEGGLRMYCTLWGRWTKADWVLYVTQSPLWRCRMFRSYGLLWIFRVVYGVLLWGGFTVV